MCSATNHNVAQQFATSKLLPDTLHYRCLLMLMPMLLKKNLNQGELYV